MSAARPRKATALGPALVVVFVVALGAVEWLLTVSVPGAAAGLGFLALALCLVLPIADERTAPILPVLVAVPVVRLVTVALLPAADQPLTRFAVVAAPAAVVVAAATHAAPRQWLHLRPGAGGWPGQAAVALVGVPLGLLVLLLAPHTVPAREELSVPEAVAILALLVVPAELLFRGLLVPALTRVVGRQDVLAAATIYAVTFIAYGLTASLTAFIVAVVLAWCRQRTNCVAGVVVAHVILVYLVLRATGT